MGKLLKRFMWETMAKARSNYICDYFTVFFNISAAQLQAVVNQGQPRFSDIINLLTIQNKNKQLKIITHPRSQQHRSVLSLFLAFLPLLARPPPLQQLQLCSQLVPLSPEDCPGGSRDAGHNGKASSITDPPRFGERGHNCCKSSEMPLLTRLRLRLRRAPKPDLWALSTLRPSALRNNYTTLFQVRAP